MNCPYCGSQLSKRDRCDRCGEDMTVFKKVYRIANQYYNIGLERAKVRDLSGAVSALKNCLKLNKRHTDARNLLGLVYHEMGETVQALSEWVISKYFQEEDNAADHFMELLQENASRLDEVNQAVKKYNGALQAARQGSDDLAILQLKKAISLNPRYLQALQLLALLYMQNGDYERARKCLVKAAKIDVNNTTTLSYLEELRQIRIAAGGEQGGAPSEESGRHAIVDRDVITPIHTYAEEKPNIMPWVNLVIGVIIGAAFIMIAIVPGIRKNAVQENSAQIVDLNEQMVEKEAALEAAQNEIASLQQDIEELEYQLNQQSEQEGQMSETVRASYAGLIEAAGYYIEEQPAEAANALLPVIRTDLEEEAAIRLYDKLSEQLYAAQSQEIYQKGHELYTAGDYENALLEFDKALLMDPENVDAMYFTGRAYHRLNDVDSAKIWYNKLVEDYPDSGRATEAADRLRELE